MRTLPLLVEKAGLVVVALTGWSVAGLFAAVLLAPVWALVAGAIVVLGSIAALVGFEIAGQRRFVAQLRAALVHLDTTLNPSDLVDAPGFELGREVHEALRRMAWAMSDRVTGHRRAEEDHRAFVEAWIHEIKLPITNLYMLAATDPGLPRGVLVEAERINRYAQQALYYARSLSVGKDYRIRAVRLDDVVDRTLRDLASPLVAAGTTVSMEGLDVEVWSDAQWLDFIVSQLLLNASQYRSPIPLHLEFTAVSWATGTRLSIQDNGIGIPAEDLPRVMDKGFVGANGRLRRYSTGIGLYLCSKLCRQMNIELDVASEPGYGTRVDLTFVHERGVLLGGAARPAEPSRPKVTEA